MRKVKSDKIFEKESDTYAWADVDGYVFITNGYSRGDGEVKLTHSEMRFMCKEYIRQHKVK